MNDKIEDKFYVSVYMEDTDFSGYVYHANYLKYFDRAREQLLGVADLFRLHQEGCSFVVRQCQVDFRKPAYCGDQICIQTGFSISRKLILSFEHAAYRVFMDQSTLLVSGHVEVVAVNQRGFPRRPPDSIMKMFANKPFPT